jgi:GTP cyclohydrolase II
VSPRITQPSAITAWYSPLTANVSAASGSSNAPSQQVAPQVLRTYGIGAQILKDLGVTRMQVLSTPKQLQGIAAFGLEITGYVAE